MSEDIDHRRFVDDEQVEVERLLALRRKPPDAGIELQQSVNGLRLAAGRFAQPFGRPAGRRTSATRPAAKRSRIAADDSGLAGAGAAGDDEELFGQIRECAARFLRCEFNRHFLLSPLDGGLGVDLGQRMGAAARALVDGHAEFGEEEGLARKMRGEAPSPYPSPGGRGASRSESRFAFLPLPARPSPPTPSPGGRGGCFSLPSPRGRGPGG